MAQSFCDWYRHHLLHQIWRYGTNTDLNTNPSNWRLHIALVFLKLIRKIEKYIKKLQDLLKK